MSAELTEMIGVVLAAGISAGTSSWFGVKYRLNGMRDDLKDVKRDVRTLTEGQSANRERLVAVETQLRGA